MKSSPPTIVILAGPNGAGKSSSAPELLREFLEVTEFVNADVIAQGLSAFNVASVAIQAGRLMLDRISQLSQDRMSFAFETTLASRSFAPWIRERIIDGYRVHLVYLWLPSQEMAIARVQTRVSLGGHDVPTETIRRRYRRGLKNLLELYSSIVTSWRIIDASQSTSHIIASGCNKQTVVENQSAWRQIQEILHD